MEFGFRFLKNGEILDSLRHFTNRDSRFVYTLILINSPNKTTTQIRHLISSSSIHSSRKYGQGEGILLIPVLHPHRLRGRH